MPRYAYRAAHATGEIARGEMESLSENELSHSLKESGLELIDARERTPRGLSFLVFRPHVALRTLATFCTRVHDLLAAGVSFPDALHDVQIATDNRVLSDALTQTSLSIANGKGIAESFSLHPHLFPPLFIALAGAGEKSGDMASAFAYLARYLSSSATMKERLVRALRYPLFLFFVAGGATAFMMAMVMPQIVLFLKGINGHMPFATRLLLLFSSAFSAYSLPLLCLLLLALAGFGLARFLSPSFSVWVDRRLLKLPCLGPIIVKTETARFCHSFFLLFKSGCDVSDCLAQARQTFGNKALSDGVKEAERRVNEGASLSRALEGVLPSFATGLLHTGERSGDVCKSLEDIAVAYDREATNALDSFLSLLEPGLTLFLGALLAWTVLAVLGPLYGSLSVLGGRM